MQDQFALILHKRMETLPAIIGKLNSTVSQPFGENMIGYRIQYASE